MEEDRTVVDERVVRIPRLGTKVCLMLAALLLITAAYFAFVPLTATLASGGNWDCGSSFSKPSAADGGGFCGNLNDVYLLRAGVFAAAALAVGVGGFLTFGADTRVERVTRREDAL